MAVDALLCGYHDVVLTISSPEIFWNGIEFLPVVHHAVMLSAGEVRF